MIGFSAMSFAQEKDSLKIKVSGFLETYYAYDFSNPITDAKLPFMYNYNRHNEFNVNNGLIRAHLQYGNTYTSIALHTGTYVQNNYASEDIKLISEAFVGMYLTDAKKSSIEAKEYLNPPFCSILKRTIEPVSLVNVAI